MISEPAPPIIDLLSRYPLEIREIALALRQMILETVPAATEKANPGWRSISFRHPGVGYFSGLFPFNDRVDLVFEWGVLLPDPENLLRGATAQTRVVPVATLSNIRREPLVALVQSAIALPHDRAARVEMVRTGAKLIQPSARSTGNHDL